MAGVEIRNQVIGLSLENSSSDLSPTSTGLVYFNTTSSIAKIYTGASWKTFLFADLSNVTGTLAIANGGTGQTTNTAAFDALAPTTTSGDTIYYNGTDNVRLPVGSNGQVLGVSSSLPAWIDAPSGSGGINYIDNNDFESSVTGWTTYADAAAATPVDGTGGSPNVTFTRNTTTPLSGNADGKFSKDAANRQGQGVAAAAVVPRGYVYGQKSKISFSWDGSHASYVAGDMVVYVFDVTNSVLITPSATSLPQAKTVVSVAFDQSGTGASYRLIFHVATTNASAYDVYWDDVIVGPGAPLQGAVVSDLQSYTPATTQGFGTVSSSIFLWRRVGSNAHISFRFTTGTVTASQAQISLPTGLTTATVAGNSAVKIAGKWASGSTSANTQKQGVVQAEPTTNVLTFSFDDYNATNSPFTAMTGSNIVASTTVFGSDGEIVVPIAEWAGSGTFVGQNDVEYAWNSATADSDDTTSFAYGPVGASIGSFTAARGKRVRFLTPIQATDEIVLQVQDQTTSPGPWVDVSAANYQNGLMPLHREANKIYGMGLDARYKTGGTDVDVRFGTYGDIGAGNPAYGDVGTAWSSFSNYKWRVRKTSGGQAVGFGHVTQTQSGLVKSAGQLLGTNTNDSAVAGYVGEKQSITLALSAANSLVNDSEENLNGSMTLTPGNWRISGSVFFQLGATTNLTQLIVAMSTTSATIPGGDTYSLASSTGQMTLLNSYAAHVPAGGITMNVPTYDVKLSTSTTLYCVVRAKFTVSTCTANGSIEAVRIR